MRSIILTIIISISFSLTCYGQTYSSLVSDKEIYTFINSVIKSDTKRIESSFFKRIVLNSKISQKWDSSLFCLPRRSTKPNIILLDLTNIFYGGELDTLLTDADRKFMFNQIMNFKDTLWHQTFKRTTFRFKKKEDFYSFSIPLFTIDKSVAIIYYSYYCGLLCAGGGYYIYKKIKDNQWKFITARRYWMS